MRRIISSRRRAISASSSRTSLAFVMPAITSEATDKHYAAVGRVAATWANFEHDIQLQIWNLANVEHDVGACMTSQIGSSGRLLDCLIALLTYRGTAKDHLKSLNSFAADVAKKQRKRNRIVHDPWFFRFEDNSPPRPFRQEISAVKLLIYETIEEPTDKLKRFVSDIHSLRERLHEIIMLCSSSSPETPQ